jgi:hypothetical protein
MLPPIPPARVLVPRILILAGLAVCGSILRADTLIYSNFGDGYQYFDGSGVIVADGSRDYSVAVELPALTADYDLTSVEFVASTESPGPSNSVSVSIYSDNGGVPGTDLETMTLNGQLAPFDGSLSPVLSATSQTNPELFAGSSYWLVMDAPSYESVVWDLNSTLTYGYLETNGTTGNWVDSPNPYSGETNGVFEVDGELVTGGNSSAPEPRDWLLMAGGIGCIVYLRRSQRSH